MIYNPAGHTIGIVDVEPIAMTMEQFVNHFRGAHGCDPNPYDRAAARGESGTWVDGIHVRVFHSPSDAWY